MKPYIKAVSSFARCTPPRLSSSSFQCTRTLSYTASRRQKVEERRWSTPLAKQLYEAISTTGPVPLASYMRMCLTGDLGGYYTGAIGRDRDQFGAKGDFVTSPEISQIFGELIGIWFMAEWISQGRPKNGVQLIEVGPGRGTLMDDMLRTIQRFPDMASSLESIFMVEASPELREKQKNLLCGPDALSSESKAGYHSNIKYNGAPVVWTETIKSIPIESDKVPFIVAHEFFDALPIHTFQTAPAAPTTAGPRRSEEQATSAAEAPVTKPSLEWREMMVSPVPPGVTPTDSASFRTDKDDAPAEFQLVLSSGTTRHSRYLPESSPRYRKLKNVPDSVVEICPDATIFASDFAARIGGSSQYPKSKPSGAALILDYGTSDTVPINSLRGIRQHRLVNPFTSPGLVDLSADVDFTAIADAATLASEGVEVHGPVPQGFFLESMGIQQRAEMLTKAPGVDESTAANVNKAWKRLVNQGPGGMGKTYKALAILPENGGQRRPVGFGGDVAEN